MKEKKVLSVRAVQNKKVASREATYQSIQARMGETVRLAADEMVIVSEYNTRCSFVDKAHVEHLAQLIRERGFHPKRAVSVNIVQNASGEITARRVVAGRHRLEAAKLAGLSEIPCLLYYGLTEKEECLLDRWDNEMDEEHKPVHFLDEAEHFRFLAETKGWSQRKIAQVKGVSKGAVGWKLKIAALPEQVKTFVKSAHPGGHLAERYFRDICKLKNPAHMVLICKEIMEKGEAAREERVDERGRPFSSMTKKEVFSRVDELLELESRGGLAPDLAELASSSEPPLNEKHPEITQTSETTASLPVEASLEEPEEVPNEEQATLAKLRGERLKEQQTMGPLGVSSEERSTEAMKFDITPRWLRRSKLRKDLGADWDLFDVLVEFGMRYQYGKKTASSQEYFFIEGRENTPEGSYSYLAELCNVTLVTLKKKLRRLIQKGYIQMILASLPQYPRFQICWEKLKEEYDSSAWFIRFDEGGLEDIPATFSGTIEPTPVHTIWVRDGVVCKDIDHAVSETMEELKKLGARTNFVRKLLRETDLGTLRRVLALLPHFMESHQQKTGEKIDKPLSFFLGCLKEVVKDD